MCFLFAERPFSFRELCDSIANKQLVNNVAKTQISYCNSNSVFPCACCTLDTSISMVIFSGSSGPEKTTMAAIAEIRRIEAAES